MQNNNSPANIERLMDVEMNVTVRFGLTELPLRELVNLGNGSMIELNRTVDEPVELLVNNYPFASGEVVVVDGYYGVRITKIASPEERSHKFMPKEETEKSPNNAQPAKAKKPQPNPPKQPAPQAKPQPQKPPQQKNPPKPNPAGNKPKEK